ncbi:sarcosine oxidase subunit alpha family protein [Rubrimonas cliftonensis]|uniref:Sarcosine oxidase subunit alpha n=1 Tax=Rubrimonas cliftonensis TaxID=89524 RepID=A0A1H4A2Q5_9RHOB|nr:sarcosine oxidase subunit alpha family protein [Rubrimonas cliftonensis]SEA29754.1 sarcosine oxidase subunit alpha [Rubrimonas cliftonensis]
MTAARVAGYGRIDRSRKLGFTFDGRTHLGHPGDTLASALLADDVMLMGRSYKYHRPRGPVTAGSEEPNALVGVDRGPGRYTPNLRATTIEIHDGLKAESQNHFPSLKWDFGAVNDMMSPLFAAGFYYKTFMWPKSFWRRVYEPVIRQAAGLGRPPKAADPDLYADRYAHCDVLVVGAGAAGLAAAEAAAISGAKVMLVDEQAEPGGALLAEIRVEIDDAPAQGWLAARLAALNARANVTVLARTTAIGLYHQNLVGLVQRLTDHLAEPPEGAPRERLWRVRAKQVVLAQGAIERPLVFDGNDRPGVMLADAARTYLTRYGVRVGAKPVVVTAHDWAWGAAVEMARAGASPVVVDARDTVSSALLAEAQALGVEALTGWTVTATHGRLRVKGVTANPVRGAHVGAGRRLPADAVLMSGGWTPTLHLHSHVGSPIAWAAEREAFLPAQTAKGVRVAGAGAGAETWADALGEGAQAGAAAAADAGFDAAARVYAVSEGLKPTGRRMKEMASHLPSSRQRAFVDFQNDVTAKDIRLAVQEGFRSIEHVKRYTTSGMATDQGKLSNINALTIAADALDKEPPQVGLTTFRPPYTPTTFGALAGHAKGKLFQPTRRTPIDPWAEANGAVFEPVSQWRRAWWFPRKGESMHEAVLRECAATRERVGLFDASTLGKIEVVGPDAAEFLERIYTNPWRKLGVGRCRYGLMLGEDGFIRDDGVIGRVAEDRFHVTTTTGGAPRVLAHMEDYLQTEFTDLRVWLTSVTEQWAVIALNGPRARDVIAPFVEGQDLAPEAFPHMSLAECRVCGVPARLMRVSFTGELGFEVNVPARHGRAVWEALWAEAQKHDGLAYGTETMHVLRAEKGYIIVGQDTDGTVTPDDAGIGWAVGKAKADFVGKRSLARPDLIARGRKQLVGLAVEGATPLEEGMQLVDDPAQPVPMTCVGHVTSSYRSAALGRPIALALVENGRARMGETLHAPDPALGPGGARSAVICSPVFYDPEGARLDA